MTSHRPPDESDEQENEFVVDYIKSQLFRIVYAEGFWGGLTVGQNIHISFWNSREAIPRQMRYRLNSEGEIEEVGRTVRADQVREVEVGVLMDLDTAKVLREWLDDVITQAEEITMKAEEEGDSNA